MTHEINDQYAAAWIEARGQVQTNDGGVGQQRPQVRVTAIDPAVPEALCEFYGLGKLDTFNPRTNPRLTLHVWQVRGRGKLLDRFDDSYSIERFSGGESDVASLCARVALSRIVASRGDNTLGFLVLDEVFGSLDAGRRNNVLLALERLKRSFGQIFIISHVAEVQESALVDEVWMLEEDEEGKSTVTRANTAMTPVPGAIAGAAGGA